MGLGDKDAKGMSNRAGLEKSRATTGRHPKAARELLRDESPPAEFWRHLNSIARNLVAHFLAVFIEPRREPPHRARRA